MRSQSRFCLVQRSRSTGNCRVQSVKTKRSLQHTRKHRHTNHSRSPLSKATTRGMHSFHASAVQSSSMVRPAAARGRRHGRTRGCVSPVRPVRQGDVDADVFRGACAVKLLYISRDGDQNQEGAAPRLGQAGQWLGLSSLPLKEEADEPLPTGDDPFSSGAMRPLPLWWWCCTCDGGVTCCRDCRCCRCGGGCRCGG